MSLAGAPSASPVPVAAPRIGGRPRLTLDVGPLLEPQWTGIPIFTRRLVDSLLRDGRLDLSFSVDLTRIPYDLVLAALRAQTGMFLRQEYDDHAARHYDTIDPDQPVMYPSVKKPCGVCAYEASTVHDISTIVMPENHEAANVAFHLDHLAEELASDTTVFCVSRATQEALETYFPSVRNRTRILYQFADWPDEFGLMDRNLPQLRLPRYAVVIGTLEPRKNLGILLRALGLPEVARSDLRFVIIGKAGWLVDKAVGELTPAQRERLIFTGFVSEFVKYRLIAAAEFMVFPSLYEGFGIPALEAMSLGKPVLASFTSSFPEVIGEAGVYFDPLSVYEFAAGLAEIEGRVRDADHARRARAQAAQFAWGRMAAPVVEWVRSIS